MAASASFRFLTSSARAFAFSSAARRRRASRTDAFRPVDVRQGLRGSGSGDSGGVTGLGCPPCSSRYLCSAQSPCRSRCNAASIRGTKASLSVGHRPDLSRENTGTAACSQSRFSLRSPSHTSKESGRGTKAWAAALVSLARGTANRLDALSELVMQVRAPCQAAPCCEPSASGLPTFICTSTPAAPATSAAYSRRCASSVTLSMSRVLKCMARDGRGLMQCSTVTSSVW
mmetsp:Transcript_33813/g.109255  ORF Transcript_33813/g.109255 Transcript_33813/m.109255 type:complete len:230 (+) Transcript_33813:477-1166(+)